MVASFSMEIGRRPAGSDVCRGLGVLDRTAVRRATHGSARSSGVDGASVPMILCPSVYCAGAVSAAHVTTGSTSTLARTELPMKH